MVPHRIVDQTQQLQPTKRSPQVAAQNTSSESGSDIATRTSRWQLQKPALRPPKRASVAIRRKGHLPTNELILLPLHDDLPGSPHISLQDPDRSPEQTSEEPSTSQRRRQRHNRLVSVIDRQRNYKLSHKHDKVTVLGDRLAAVSIGDHPAYTKAELKRRSKPSPIKLIINHRSVRKTPTSRRLVFSQILQLITGPLPLSASVDCNKVVLSNQADLDFGTTTSAAESPSRASSDLLSLFDQPMQTAMDEVTKAEAPVMPGSTPQDLAEENIPHLRPAVTAPKRTLLVSSGKWDISAPHGTPDVIPASRSKPSQPPETAMTSEISLLEAIMLESEETSKGAVADAENHDRPSSQRKQSSPIHRRTLGTAKNSLLSQTRACESGLSSGLAQQPVGDQTGADVLGDGQAHSTALDDPDSQAEVIYRGPLAGPAQHDPAAPLLRQKKSSTFMSRRAMSTIERQIARDARYKADTHDADDEDEGGSEDDNTRMDQSSRPGVPPAQVLINESDTSEGRLDKEYGTRFKTPKRRPPRQESEYAPVRPRPKRQKILQESSMASDIIPITKTRTKTWSRVLRPRQNAGNGVPLPIQHERNNALDSDKQRTDIENVRTDHPPTRPFEQVQIDSCPPWSFHRSPVVPSDSEDEQDIDPCPAWMETAKQADTDAGDHERPNGQHPKQHKPPQTSEVVPEKQDIVAIQRGASAQSPPDTIRVRQDSHSEDEYGGWDGDGGVHGMWSWPDPYA